MRPCMMASEPVNNGFSNEVSTDSEALKALALMDETYNHKLQIFLRMASSTVYGIHSSLHFILSRVTINNGLVDDTKDLLLRLCGYLESLKCALSDDFFHQENNADDIKELQGYAHSMMDGIDKLVKHILQFIVHTEIVNTLQASAASFAFIHVLGEIKSSFPCDFDKAKEKIETLSDMKLTEQDPMAIAEERLNELRNERNED